MKGALAHDVGLARSRSKLRIARQTLIVRPRLIRRLDEAGGARLCVIQAPAGYGKTSVLQLWSSFLAETGRPTAWISLDETDREPVLLVRRVLQAFSEVGQPPEAHLSSMLATGGAQSAQAIIAAAASAFASHPAGACIVLDDAHNLLGSEAMACLEQLVSSARPELKLVLATREDLGAALKRPRALGEAFELGAEDLAFDEAETRAFLEGLGYDDLSASDVAALHHRTEGWPAGLKLFSLMRRGSELPVEAFTGEVRQLADYFVEAVLAWQPPSLRDFMLRSSVLEWLTPDICDDVLGIGESDEFLRLCHDRGLFLGIRDDGQGAYRWHQLFAEHLRRTLHDRDPEATLRLHRHAAEWLAEHGRPVEAFEHGLKANAPEFAARILDDCCEALWSDGRQATLEQLALRLPPDVLAAHPRTMLLLVWRWVARWRLEDARSLLAVSVNSLGRLQAAGQDPAFLCRQNWLALHREAQIAHAAYDLPALEAHSTKLIQNADAVDDPYLLASCYNSLQYAQREQLKLGKVEQWTELAQGHGAGVPQAQVFVAAISGASYLLMGQSDRALKLLSGGLAVAKAFAGDPTPLAAMAAMPLARAHCERDELDRAWALLNRYMPHATQLGFADQLVDGWLTKARLLRLGGDADGACAALDEALEFGARLDLERLQVMAGAERALMMARSGEFDEAAHLLRRCGMRGDAQPRATRMRFTAQDSAMGLAWCRLAAARAQVGEALAVARQWRSLLVAAKAAHAAVEWEILLSELLVLSGERNASLRCVAQAVARAAPGRLIRPFRDGGAPVASLLGELAGGPGVDAEAQVFLRDLLARLGANHLVASAALTEIPDDDDDAALMGRLIGREIQIVRLAGAGLSNREIGESLGLTEGTVKWYLQQAFDKIGLRDRIRAAEKLRRLGVMR